MLKIPVIAGFDPTRQTGQPKAGSARDDLLARIRKADPDKADALKRRMEESQSLTTQMEALRRGMKQAPKADAAQRVARIKEEIRLLRTMGGDPKMVARRIAQLARELGQAARAYAAAGGMGGDAATPTPTAQDHGASPGVGTNASVASAGIANGANGAGPVSLNTSPNAADAPPNMAFGMGGGPSDPTGGAPTVPSAGTSTHEAKLDGYHQAHLAELRDKAGASAARAGEAEGDRAFRDEVRSLIEKLKQLARQVAQQLKEAGEGENPDLASARQGLADAEKAASQIGVQAAMASGGGVSVFV